MGTKIRWKEKEVLTEELHQAAFKKLIKNFRGLRKTDKILWNKYGFDFKFKNKLYTLWVNLSITDEFDNKRIRDNTKTLLISSDYMR